MVKDLRKAADMLDEYSELLDKSLLRETLWVKKYTSLRLTLQIVHSTLLCDYSRDSIISEIEKCLERYPEVNE